MITADYIAIGTLLVFILLGFTVGFGKGLKFFTSGTFGKILSVVACYFLFGVVLAIPLVQSLLDRFITFLRGKENWFFNVLITIRIDLIVLGVALFAAVQIARMIIVAIIGGIMGINNPFIKFINRMLGIVLFLCVLAVITLIFFQAVKWIGGETDASVRQAISGSVVKLDFIYDNNPLLYMVESIKAGFSS